ncbi:MAG TPA: translation initiation factor IF-2 [Ktedonobacteraceae bacterium]|nr:translation initiation factor IF-2 [Ktedonobacteraceae bacterium]
MRNTPEFPEGIEQVKPTATKSRTPARPKTDSANNTTPDSQDQEARPTTTTSRRRTTPAGANTTGTDERNTTRRNSAEGATASSASSAGTARPAPAALTQRPNRVAPTTPVGDGVPAPRQRTEGALNNPTPRQRTEGALNNPTPRQRTEGALNNPTPRPRTEGANNNPAPRPRTEGMNTNPTPRQRIEGANAPAQQRNSGTYGQAQRPGGPNTFAQRPPNPATRPNTQGGTGNYYPSSPAGQPGRGTGTARPGNAGPGVARPGGQGRPSSTRPSYGGHAPGGRPGNRNGSTAQRPQERRTPAVKEKPTGPISIPPQIVVKDLAELLHATPNEIIKGLIKHKIFASINQVVEYDKAALVAQDLSFEPQQSTITTAPATTGTGGLSANEAMMASRNEENMVVIPPVVTIMGHVDHGKTSLLDTIRKTKVAAGEAGGITQHIGAYQVEINGKKITFLDTPGHEAFTAMRARGAQVTHIAIIVVAADDGVMPQTREAIDHAQAAKVPVIIALNKIDKANANPDHVKQQLAEIGVVIEEYGGDVVCVPVSARRGTGIDELLEMILLVAEVQDIRANPNRPATGTIIEAKLEKNIGPTATVLIQQGTLKMGDNIVVGHLAGKIRAMFNDRGKRIQKAPPSMPVSILGLPEVPNAGDHLTVVADERTAKQMAGKVAEQRRMDTMPLGQVSLDTLYMQMQEGKVKELNIVLKCDVQGSAEAIKNALTKVGEENIKVRLIHEGIGNINETDVHLASASEAVIIGFNVKADGAAQRQAQKEGVDIRYYNVIYKLTDDIQAALTGMLEPTFHEVIEGHAEVLQTFKSGKTTVIAGCRVTDGKITRSSSARITRNNEKVYDGKIASIRRGKDDVREVATGYECGITLEDFTAIEVGDIIETFNQERVKPGA